MNLLFVTQVYAPYLDKGGPVAKVRGLARHLAARGHGVEILTARHGTGRAPLPTTVDGLPVTYLRSPLRYRTATLNPGILRRPGRRVGAFDLVHVFGLYDGLGPVIAWSCRRRGVPYVLEPLGMFVPVVRSVWKKRLYHQMAGRPLLRHAAAVLVTSPREEAQVRENAHDPTLPGRLVVRRNGLDLAEFATLPLPGTFRARAGIGAEERLVLFLGRVSYVKGVDLLGPAAAALGAGTRLVVAGPDDRDGSLAQLQQAGPRNLLVTGLLDEAEKRAALVDADCLVLPSRHESFGNVVAEAIACGTPVVVSEACGIAPLVRDRVGLVVPCTAEGVRDGLQRLLGDPALQRRFRERCPEVAQELTWDEPVRLMEEVYARALAGGRREGSG